MFLHFRPFYNLTSNDLRPLTLYVTFDLMNIRRSPYNINKFGSNWTSTVQMTWPQMTFDIGIWHLTSWTCEGSNNEVWFQSDFNFSSRAKFTLSAYLTTWPQMTIHLGIWPLTSSTNEDSFVASMTQDWLKSINACERVQSNVNHFSKTTTTVDKAILLSFLLRQATQKICFFKSKQTFYFL